MVDSLDLEDSTNANWLISQGEALSKQGKTEAALSSFREAMQYLPKDPLVLQRIAETYANVGRLAEANQAYYTLFNEARWQSVGGSPNVYLGYALVLVKTGQEARAVRFYQEGAGIINSLRGGNAVNVALPQVVAADPSPDQVEYTPERLQALVDTALAHEEAAFGSNKEAIAHMQEAVRLYPNSPVTNYYLGEVQLKAGASIEAKVAYQKAAWMGDAQVAAAAKVRLAQ